MMAVQLNWNGLKSSHCSMNYFCQCWLYSVCHWGSSILGSQYYSVKDYHFMVTCLLLLVDVWKSYLLGPIDGNSVNYPTTQQLSTILDTVRLLLLSNKIWWNIQSFFNNIKPGLKYVRHHVMADRLVYSVFQAVCAIEIIAWCMQRVIKSNNNNCLFWPD